MAFDGIDAELIALIDERNLLTKKINNIKKNHLITINKCLEQNNIILDQDNAIDNAIDKNIDKNIDKKY